MTMTKQFSPDGSRVDAAPSANAASERCAAPMLTVTATPATAARDQELWQLASRLEQQHRSAQALQMLVKRRTEKAVVVAVSPRLAMKPEPALPSSTPTSSHPWWPSVSLPDRPLKVPPGNLCCTLALDDVEAIAVSVLGLRGADLEQAVEVVSIDQQKSMAFKPVFLTDSPDFGPMTRRGYAIEYVPQDHPSTVVDSVGVPVARMAFISRKWGIQRCVDLREIVAPAVPSVLVPPKKAPRPVNKRGRVAVVSWDLGHNPVGRAMVIYDLLERDWEVELVGPLWSRFGGKLWGPIADSPRKVRGFACETLEEFWPAALAFASAADYDLVVVCKPRLPALLIGALLKRSCACPLVLDVDDFELSFFKDETTATLDALDEAGHDALREPYGELATRACDGVIRDADALVVSNVALRNRFGGTIVRHARNEDDFRPDRFDRHAERSRMGMIDSDFAIVFVGTARAHKGVFDIARTLSRLPDKRFVLHIVGDIVDKRVRNELDRHEGARIVYHPDCSFGDLPARIVAADVVVLLQDVNHPISQFQIPAKVTDASAFGLPILVTDVPPLRDMVLQGVVTVTTAADLGDALERLLRERASGDASTSRIRVREAFEADLGFRVNRERLDLAIARAAEAGPGLPPSFDRLLDITAKAYARMRPARHHLPAAPVVLDRKAAPFDIVMFWKQNDTGLYGRRSDMLMKYLLASGRVGRILQFDAPVEVTDLARLAEPGRGSAAPMILANTIDNQFGLRDGPRHALRTFVWDRRGRPPVLPGVGRTLADYPAYVEAQMQQAGIQPENTFAWVCPVVLDFPAIAARIPFKGIIGDLIDDQRNFVMSEAYRPKIAASYAATLPLFNLAFTNCAPQAKAFGDICGDIRVIPNGTETVSDCAATIPPALAMLKRPVAGYVGNLRDRIDWHLLRHCAIALPDVSFAIVGGGARDEDAALLEGLPNVLFTGVVPYEQVQAVIQSFDVALVPHLRNHLTVSMNPLKIYNYFAAARPIVSTGIENVDSELRPFIRFAADEEGFVDAIGQALSADRPGGAGYEEALAGITWTRRATDVLKAIDAWQAAQP